MAVENADQPVDQVELYYAVLEIAAGLPPQYRKQLSGLTAKARSRLRSHIDASELALKHPCLVSYWAQFNELPESHKNGFTWLEVAARLLKNPRKLERALRMHGGGQLFWVEKDGTVNFKDKGVEPVMYVINRKKGKMTPIFDYDTEAIQAARKKIAKSRARWQKVPSPSESPKGRQSLDWANGADIKKQLAKDGYELFPCEPVFDEETYHETFGPAMDHAAAVNPKGRFVASNNGDEMRWSWVEGGGGIVCFRGNYDKHLVVHDRHPEERSLDNMGVVRRLRI